MDLSHEAIISSSSANWAVGVLIIYRLLISELAIFFYVHVVLFTSSIFVFEADFLEMCTSIVCCVRYGAV